MRNALLPLKCRIACCVSHQGLCVRHGLRPLRCFCRMMMKRERASFKKGKTRRFLFFNP